MRLRPLFILLFLTAMSCKDGAKNEQNQTNAPEPAKNVFKVFVTGIVKNTDDFCLLYTQDGSANFKEGVWKAVPGNEAEQVVEFALPEDVFPTQLRLDLGRKQDQGDIILKSIKFDYLGNTRELKGAEMGAFFRADDSKCTFDATTGLVKAVVKDGKRESPSLYPHENVMAAELPKLAK